MRSELDIQANQSSRPAHLDRAACETWALAPTDQPVSIVVKPQQAALPTASTSTTTSSDARAGDRSPDDVAATQSEDDDDGFPLGIVVISAVLVGLAAASVIWHLRSRHARAAT